MHSVIGRKQKLGELFSNTEGLREVYADVTYDFTEPSIVFTLLGKNVNTSKLLFQLCDLGASETVIYYTEDSLDLAIAGKKIIWRDNVWYL